MGIVGRSLLILLVSLPLAFSAQGKGKEIMRLAQTDEPGSTLDKDLELGPYVIVIEGFDWGPAVSKVILEMDREVALVEPEDFTVDVQRKAKCTQLEGDRASGKRKILRAYVSDQRGNEQNRGTFVTLELEVAPHLSLSNPFAYDNSNGCSGNDWVEYQLQIKNSKTNRTWNREKDRIMPLVDEFDLEGKFRSTGGEVEMSFAQYHPPEDDKTNALIIWLHGGGEGGSDPRIPLLANRAANYASEEIQDYFGGAYVLVPQCPGAWMDNERGVVTWGAENDVYNVELMSLITDFVAKNPDIDAERIYVGGCSNGGYMSLKLILLNPDYFAAGFISALAYRSEYISDEQIRSIAHVPIWFIHSRDDMTTPPQQTVVPVYRRLKENGAQNVHFSFFDHVIDISGKYGGEELKYPGHWSWIYSHANKCHLDLDGKPVIYDGSEVSLMSWMASQRNEK